jgi:hypothetical protein
MRPLRENARRSIRDNFDTNSNESDRTGTIHKSLQNISQSKSEQSSKTRKACPKDKVSHQPLKGADGKPWTNDPPIETVYSIETQKIELKTRSWLW